MFRQKSFLLFKTLVALIVLAFWGTGGYFISETVIESRNNKQLEETTARLKEHGETMANNINTLFGYYRGAAKAIAATPLLNSWTGDLGSHHDLNRYLLETTKPLGVDLIWILNDKGMTVAASNNDQPDSFVGHNFSYREYFNTGIKGHPAYLYSVGHVTHIPGLYFSEPIRYRNKIVGVAVVKINLPTLAKVLVDEDALLADKYGVVILSKNPAHAMNQLPNATIKTLPAEIRQARYKRVEFPTLDFSPNRLNHHPEVRSFEGRNVIHAIFPIGVDDATFHLVREVAFLDSEFTEIIILALVLTSAGFTSTYAILFFLLNYMHERSFRSIFNNSAIGLVVLDEHHRFLEFNQEFERYLGYSIDELIGLTPFHITYDEDRDKLPIASDLAADETPIYIQKRYVRRDGRIVWARVSVRHFASWFRRQRSLIVVEDITAQKLAEEKIKHQEAQMITTAKMSALGEMAAGIAHEINNPLAIISASAERLHFLVELEKLSPEKACELSRKITGTVGRIAKIISGLRSFARQGAKDQFNAVHVQTIVDDTLSFCQERLRHASIQLNVRIEPPDLAIMCRPAEISQVLLNLLNNAHDALHDQPVREIEIGAAIISDATEIWVKDSGSGIPPEVRSKIMQPFFTTKDIGKGTGLGLSISSGIAAAHGGSLRLDESSPQTRFVVRLPAGPAASAEPSQERLSKAS